MPDRRQHTWSPPPGPGGPNTNHLRTVHTGREPSGREQGRFREAPASQGQQTEKKGGSAVLHSNMQILNVEDLA